LKYDLASHINNIFMKKIFPVLLVIFVASSSFAQTKTPDLLGTWKVILKTSGMKRQPPPEYLVLMDDSVYTIGVDSLGNNLSDASSGRWTVMSDGTLLLFPSDRIAERRYYKPSGDNRFTYIGTTLKKAAPMLEMDIYL
jgi:hypothetical protein